MREILGNKDSAENMASNAWFGFGSPVSKDGPVKKDEELEVELDTFMEAQGVLEDNSDLLRRITVLSRLEKLCKDWIMDVYRDLGTYSEPQIQQVGGVLFTFGSYRLGVHFKGGDIDTLLLAPRRVDRDRFFSEMPNLLKNLPDVDNLTAVPEAFAPIIKMSMSGIEIDMLFCQSTFEQVTPNFDILHDDCAILRGMPAKDVRSLNGCRVNEYILTCIPKDEVFRKSLRIIKLWARNRAIYSNVMGYLGGISWAILVAFTCQKYPNANAATVVRKMFLIFSLWVWPQPVFIRDPRELDVVIDGFQGGLSVWDPRVNMHDRTHIMPIITPVFPQQNTTYNVSTSQFMIMIAEIKRGNEICRKIEKGEVGWEKLFERLSFFPRYRHFLAVIASCEPPGDLKAFTGLLESRLRRLVELLERHPKIRLCHLFPRQFDVRKNPKAPKEEAKQWLIGLEFSKSESSDGGINLNDHAYAFLLEVKQLMTRTEKPEYVNCKAFTKHLLRKGLTNHLTENDLKIFPEIHLYSQGRVLKRPGPMQKGAKKVDGKSVGADKNTTDGNKTTKRSRPPQSGVVRKSKSDNELMPPPMKPVKNKQKIAAPVDNVDRRHMTDPAIVDQALAKDGNATKNSKSAPHPKKRGIDETEEISGGVVAQKKIGAIDPSKRKRSFPEVEISLKDDETADEKLNKVIEEIIEKEE